MGNKYPSTLLVSLADKLEKIADKQVRQDIETEIRKADLDLLAKINEIVLNASLTGPFVPLLPNPLVSGEPSLGTPHPQAGTHTAWLLTQAVTAGNWYTVTFAVPAGTRAVLASCRVLFVAAGDDLRWRPYNNGDSYANSFHRKIVGGNINSGYNEGIGIFYIDASGRVDVTAGASTSTVYVGYPQFYFL